MAKTTVATQLARLRKEREALERKEKALLAKTNDKVLGKIVALAKEAGLTAEDIAKAMRGTAGAGRAKVKAAGAKKGPLAGKKVAPKYRNPADHSQTWTGRGVAPVWAKALKDAGKLESAAI